jgi:NTP pyrophosphatase (non-canonical NTP hydrolase)
MNTCICCGEVIPEGLQVCLNCEKTLMNKRTVVKQIGKAAVLEQLAEEATELAQAALKYARKWRGENPTPKTIKEIIANLIEEYTDVTLCAEVLKLDADPVLKEQKMKRWQERIQK